MSARPMRKKSALTGGAAAVIAPAAPVPPAAPAPGAARAAAVERLTVRVPSHLMGEVRAAWWTTASTTGVRSMSAWVIEALEAHLASERAAHNQAIRSCRSAPESCRRDPAPE